MKVSPRCVNSEVCPADVGVKLEHLADVLSGFPPGLFRGSSYRFYKLQFPTQFVPKIYSLLTRHLEDTRMNYRLTYWHTVTSVP
jgi:hypothetical protein